MTAPTIQEYEAAANAWGNSGNLTTPAGLTLSSTSSVLEILDGFSAAVFKDASGNLIVSFEGAYSNLNSLTGLVYDVTSTLADTAVAEGKSTSALSDAASFVASLAKANPKASIFVTGTGLGGVEAEAAVKAEGAKVTGGATFGAMGLPGNTSPGPTSLTDYVNYGDPVGNYASDPLGPLQSVAPANMDHYGNVVMVGNATESSDLSLLATDVTATTTSNGFNGAASTLPGALEIYSLNTELFHGMGSYTNAVDTNLGVTPPTSTPTDLAATSVDLVTGLQELYAEGTAAATVASAVKPARTAVSTLAAVGGSSPAALTLGGGVVVNDNAGTGQVTLSQPGTVDGNAAGGVDIVTDLASGTAAAVAGTGVGAGAATDNGGGAYSVTATGASVDLYAATSLGGSVSATAPASDTVGNVAGSTSSAIPPLVTVNVDATGVVNLPSPDPDVTPDGPENVNVTNGGAGPVTVTINQPPDVIDGLAPNNFANGAFIGSDLVTDVVTLDGYNIADDPNTVSIPASPSSTPSTYVSSLGYPLDFSYQQPSSDPSQGDGTLTVTDTSTGDSVILTNFLNGDFGVYINAIDEGSGPPSTVPLSTKSPAVSHLMVQAMASLAPSGGALSTAAASATAGSKLVSLAVSHGNLS